MYASVVTFLASLHGWLINYAHRPVCTSPGKPTGAVRGERKRGKEGEREDCLGMGGSEEEREDEQEKDAKREGRSRGNGKEGEEKEKRSSKRNKGEVR